MPINKLKEQGSLAVPMGCLILGCFIGAVYFIHLMRDWTALTRLQLKMDECIGKKAITLKKIQNEIETLNTTIEGLRASEIVTDVLAPGATIAILTSIRVAIIAQDFELARWKTESVFWFTESCGGGSGQKVFKSPLPQLKWERPPPDALGGQPLRWVDSKTDLHLKMAGYPRLSSARVFKERSGRWESAWSFYK